MVIFVASVGIHVRTLLCASVCTNNNIIGDLGYNFFASDYCYSS